MLQNSINALDIDFSPEIQVQWDPSLMHEQQTWKSDTDIIRKSDTDITTMSGLKYQKMRSKNKRSTLTFQEYLANCTAACPHASTSQSDQKMHSEPWEREGKHYSGYDW